MNKDDLSSLIKLKITDFSLDHYTPIFRRDLDLGEPLLPKAGNLTTVIMGMRRSGKTYRLLQEIESLIEKGISRQNILYFNFEDSRLQPLTQNIGDEVLRVFYENNPYAKEEGAYLFFDEIQEIPDWGIWLRRIIDAEKATVYVTGSSAKILAAEVSTQFRGRSLTSELLPLGFKEYLRFHDLPILKGKLPTTAENLLLKKNFESYLMSGGFPAVQNLQPNHALGILQSYAELVVARDVIERHNLDNPKAATYFASIALRHNGRELSLRKTENQLRSRGVKVDRRQLSEVLSYLEDSFLLGTVRPLSRALADDPKVAAKVYAIDPGLAAANAVAPAEDIGQLLEDAVYLQLRRINPHRRDRLISSYRTKKHGYEVDFAVGDALFQDRLSLFQVCASLKHEETFERETRALREAMKEQEILTASVITLDNEARTMTFEEGRIHIIPAWIWCLDKE